MPAIPQGLFRLVGRVVGARSCWARPVLATEVLLLCIGAAAAQVGPASTLPLLAPTWPSTGGSPYSLGQVAVPPYFALHPPVYYSVPVPRTYGYSPHAYPGSMATPDVERMPEVIVNPHVESPARMPVPASRPSSPMRQVRQPLAIENPYVRAGVLDELRAAARQAGGRPASARLLP